MNIREKLSLLNEEKSKRTEEIKNKYRKQISAISGERHLLEIQLQQYPLQIKNIKAEQASWERKESEWITPFFCELYTLYPINKINTVAHNTVLIFTFIMIDNYSL